MTSFFTSVVCFFLLLTLAATAQEPEEPPIRDSLEYIVRMKSGDHFRGNVLEHTDSTITVQTEFGRVEIPKHLIAEFTAVEGPYKRRADHFLMPTASAHGPGFFISNYELGFLYGGFGLGYGATITGGMTLIPSISLKSQLYHAGVKFTVERGRNLEFALGATYSFLTTDQPYAHIYGVATMPLGTGRYSVMMFYRALGNEIAPIQIVGPGEDTTQATIYYTGSLGAAFGIDGPIMGRDDMSLVGEIWNNDLTKPQNTVSILAVRVTNEHLSADFGLALFTEPFLVPVTRFTYRY